jgi:hypothetical protein
MATPRGVAIDVFGSLLFLAAELGERTDSEVPFHLEIAQNGAVLPLFALKIRGHCLLIG